MFAYATACEEYSYEAIEAAVKAYIKGKVKRDNHTFAPSAAEFAEQVRHQQMVIDAANRPRIEKPKEQVMSQADHDRITHKLEVFNRFQMGDLSAKEELQKLVSFNLDDVNEMKRVLGR